MSSISNPGNFLRTSRTFPSDPQTLSVELSKMYIDIANEVNNRISALYGTTVSITGESWYLAGTNAKQNTLRQIFAFTAAGSIAHGINPASISQFTKCSGQYTDGTDYYGAIFASDVAIDGQITFYVTPTNIVILAGVGAPTITRGTIVLEWMSNV